VYEIEAARHVRQFGAQAVYGRALAVRETRALEMTERVVSAWQSRAGSKNWAEWAKKNPELQRVLNEVMNAGENPD
jgi:hypothetical protein